MKAIRIHRFGPPEVIALEHIPRPAPGQGEVLVRVHAAGVGPWDGWIRAGKSVLPQPLPLTLGSDISGTVAAVGAGVADLAAGDDVFGVSNARFTGGYAEYATAPATMIAKKPVSISHVEAASVPVVAVTAWQMLFDHGHVTAGQSVLVHGGAGNVGAYAVQLAHQKGARVVATGRADHIDVMRRLGADRAIDVRAERFEEVSGAVDVVIDTLGGDTQARSFAVLKPGGVLVSAVSEPDADEAARRGVRAMFILVDVTATHLTQIAAMIDREDLRPRIGAVLPLADAVRAHEMLEGSRPRPNGKIVLDLSSV